MTGRELHSHWRNASGIEGGDGLHDALFPYWSFTKTAIAICALKLVERGMLALDTPLDRQPYTLRQLLRHSAGLPDYGTLTAYHEAVTRGDTPWSREEVLDKALTQGMLFLPDGGWAYSNIGYLLVRGMIEDATGQALGAVLHDLIIEPLGLESVAFWDNLEQSKQLHWDAAQRYDPNWVYHGCLIGTASDAVSLLDGLIHGALLPRPLLDQMLDKRILGGAIAGRPWSQCGYALGLMSGEVTDFGRAIGHSGAGPFCVNAVYHFPDRADPITVACFSDGTDEGVPEFEAARIARSD